MADYRDWCGSCGREINFGSHDPGCDWLHAQRIAAKEQRDFERELRETYRGKTDEEIINEAVELNNELAALESRVNGLTRKWNFIRFELMDHRLIEEFRERTGRRYA